MSKLVIMAATFTLCDVLIWLTVDDYPYFVPNVIGQASVFGALFLDKLIINLLDRYHAHKS